jgi:hypothetical protein
MVPATQATIKKLDCRWPLIGAVLRRRAALKLIGSDDPQVVGPLLQALADPKEKVRQASSQALLQLKGQAVDHICQLWHETRASEIEKIIKEAGYIAAGPEHLKLRTTFLHDRNPSEKPPGSLLLQLLHDPDPVIFKKTAQHLLGIDDPNVVAPLLHCLKDRNKPVQKAALQALLCLRGKAIDQLCIAWESNRDLISRNIITRAGYVASQPESLLVQTTYLHGRAPQEKPPVSLLLALLRDPDESIINAAARDLVGTRDAGAVEPLLEMLTSPPEDALHKTAHHILSNMKGEAVDKLCAIWDETRNPDIKEIIQLSGYCATFPERLKRLTFLLNKTPCAELATFEQIKSYLLDHDEDVCATALHQLLEKNNEDVNELLWDLIVANPNAIFQKILYKMNWYPRDFRKRSLFYFLYADDIEKYFDIDYEQTHLHYWNETTSKDLTNKDLNNCISSKIREVGDARLLSIFKNKRIKFGIHSSEVDTEIEILAKNNEYEKLFSLLLFCDYQQCIKIMNLISKTEWLHPNKYFRELQKKLTSLMKIENANFKPKPSPFACQLYKDFRPMFFNEVPPIDERNPSGWLEDSHSFRRRGAALISLAENSSSLLKEAANVACADEYWQVRMAAGIAEILVPGTLYQKNREKLEEDHVYWVQALFKLPKNDRLHSFTPNNIERLSETTLKHKSFYDTIRFFLQDSERTLFLYIADYFATDSIVSIKND